MSNILFGKTIVAHLLMAVNKNRLRRERKPHKRKTRLCRVTGGSPPEFVYQNVVHFVKSLFRVFASSLMAGVIHSCFRFFGSRSYKHAYATALLWYAAHFGGPGSALLRPPHRAVSLVWNWRGQKFGGHKYLHISISPKRASTE